MDVQAYLNRIGITQIENTSKKFLETLINAHLETVPFENLDVIAKKPLKLDSASLFQKIVINLRGGFCYELNGLFYQLLSEIGFDVKIGAAYVYNSKEQRYSYIENVYDHMILAVQLNQLYLVDVGFGDSIRKPIALPNGHVEDVSGLYRIVRLNSSKKIYELQYRRYNHDWIPQYHFNLIFLQLKNFNYSCHWTETSPESHFTQQAVTTIATSNGRITLVDQSLTITTDKNKEKKQITDAETRKKFMKEYFGISVV